MAISSENVNETPCILDEIHVVLQMKNALLELHMFYVAQYVTL